MNDNLRDLLQIAQLRELERIRRETRKAGGASTNSPSGPKCPHCHGVLPAFGKPSKCQHCSGNLTWSGTVPLPAKRPSGPPCPHCGGELPANSTEKEFRVCVHCRRDLFWDDRKAYSSQEESKKARHAREQRAQIELAENAKKLASQNALYRECLNACAQFGIRHKATPLVIETTAGPLLAQLCPLWAPGLAYAFAGLAHHGHFLSGDSCSVTVDNTDLYVKHPFGISNRIAKHMRGLLATLGVRKSYGISCTIFEKKTASMLRSELCGVATQITELDRATQKRQFQLHLELKILSKGTLLSIHQSPFHPFHDSSIGGLRMGDNVDTLNKIVRRCWLTKQPFKINRVKIG